MAVSVFPMNNSPRPDVRIKSNTDAITGSASGSDKTLVLLGTAQGGTPNVPVQIENYATAKETFVGGDLLDAIELAFNPSDGSISSGPIIALRVGNPTQSTYTNAGLTVTSKDYAASTNQVQVALTDNQITGAKDFQVVYQPDRYNSTYTGIGNIFGIKYTGAMAYASVTVEGGAGTLGQATKLTLKAGNDKETAVEAASFTLGMGLYSSTYQLVNDINGISGFEAEYFPSGNKIGVETKYFDALAETQLKSDTDTYITTIGGDLLNTVNVADSEIEVSYDPSKGEPVAFPLTQLAGGTDGEVPQTWSPYFNTLQDGDGFYIVPLTDSPAIQAEAIAWAKERSQESNPTRVILGGGINESAQQTQSRVSALRSERAMFMATSGSRLMNDGTTKQLPAYMVAAMLGGIASGIPVGMSIYRYPLDLVSIDQKFTSEQLDVLDTQGIVAIQYVRNRNALVFRTTDDVTTYGSIDDPTLGLMSAGEASDFLTVDLRTMLYDTFLGTMITTGAAKEIKAAIIAFLTTEKSLGVIMDFDESDITVVTQGSKATISIAVVPSLVLRKINVDIIYNPETITA